MATTSAELLASGIDVGAILKALFIWSIFAAAGAIAFVLFSMLILTVVLRGVVWLRDRLFG